MPYGMVTKDLKQGVLSLTIVSELLTFKKKSRTDSCPNTPQDVQKKSTKFVEIIHSRYFHKHVEYHIQH